MKLTGNKSIRWVVWGLMLIVVCLYVIKINVIPFAQERFYGRINLPLKWDCNRYLYHDHLFQKYISSYYTSEFAHQTLMEIQQGELIPDNLIAVGYMKIYGSYLERDFVEGLEYLKTFSAVEKDPDKKLNAFPEIAYVSQLCLDVLDEDEIYKQFSIGAEKNIAESIYFKYLYDIEKLSVPVESVLDELIRSQNYQFTPPVLELNFQYYLVREELNTTIYKEIEDMTKDLGIFDNCDNLHFFLNVRMPYADGGKSRKAFIKDVAPSFYARCLPWDNKLENLNPF